MRNIYKALQERRDIRQQLIALKQKLKEDGALEEYLSMTEDDELIASFLQDADAKTRKNAAQTLGLLKSQESLDALWEAYEREQTLFVKSAYLLAMKELNYKAYKEALQKRFEALRAYEPKEEEKKHVQEELHALFQLVYGLADQKRHRFTGMEEPCDFILTTMKNYQEVTKKQVKTGASRTFSLGVQVKDGLIAEAYGIRTFQELLIPVKMDKASDAVQKEGGLAPEQLAEQLAGSMFLEQLEAMHEGKPPFAFRAEVKGGMDKEEKNQFVKRFAAELERQSGFALYNDAGNYEVELCLIQKASGGFLPCMKLYTIPKKRFAYRRYTTATSMAPSLAALLVELSGEHQYENAQVLDAFCGTATLLIERIYRRPVRSAYGLDTYGEAIRGARENAAIAHMDIHFVQRDALDFTHAYLFDEIWADMPVNGKKERSEQDRFYQVFFERMQDLLKPHGRMFLYCNENGLVKKYIRIQGAYRLKQEYLIREKQGFYLFVIEYKG